jgi:hypothetical protein
MDIFRPIWMPTLLYAKLPQPRFYYVATGDMNFERDKKPLHGTFGEALEPRWPLWALGLLSHAANVGRIPSEVFFELRVESAHWLALR